MAASWRDKYLAALDEQESQERRFQHQIKQLRSCIDHLSQAADGIDPTLDELLAPLNKKKSSSRINVEDITNAAKQVSDRRETRTGVSQDALNALVDYLKNLNPSRSVKTDLNKYQGNIGKRVGKLHAYPQLLRELSELHAATLDNVIHKRPNWMASLLGAPPSFKEHVNEGDSGNPADDTTDVFEQDKANDDPIIEEGDLAEKETALEPSVIEGEYHIVSTENTEEDVDNLLVSSDKDVASFEQSDHQSEKHTEISNRSGIDKHSKFTKIEDKISIILTEMLDSVDVEECVKEKFNQSKVRISQGLNWYEMVATLEDVRDLFLQALCSANQDFESYLENIDTALSELKQLIPEQAHHNQLQKALVGDIQQGLSERSTALVENLDQVTDLDVLKKSVADHVTGLAIQLQNLDTLSTRLAESSDESLLLKQKIQELEDNQQKLKQELSEQKHRALHDVLTGLPNRDFYNQWIYKKYSLWKNGEHELVISICDVDNFKSFNDTYGHQTGDRVLKLIGKLLGSIKNPENFVGRYGGEEFILVFSSQEVSQCEALIEKVRKKLATTSFRFKEKPVTITASFGLAQFTLGDSIETALKRADDALYKAKANGKNCLYCA
ncbi:GGDEF domain-containing protein [Sessilibacter corallicola]|uniref:GGDEF domain-containing protein n=1 Tax=Sessilibacter corallicola TaxID=2904075 RepID=UPI001E594148|nr:GGDEF domain-containing protein [Sessilibacter corallicola]MCE2028122.1 diguanylate cyclase [Sessilibacter corallicola]